MRQVKSLAGGQKIGLVVVFSLGIITMTVSAGRFISMMYTGNYISVCKCFFFSSSPSWMLSNRQQNKKKKEN